MNYKPEGLDPNDEPVTQEKDKEEEENSNAECAKVELTYHATLGQSAMHH